MTTNVVLTLLIYLVTCVTSVAAIALAMSERHGRRGLEMLLAVAAILVSGMGLTGWTPFGFFPEFGWSLANGPFNMSIRSQWLFILPLMLAVFASFLKLRKYGKQANKA